MTTQYLAIDIIASSADLENSGQAADILMAYQLATGLSIPDTTLWDDLPLGAGGDLIDFAKSHFYAELPDGTTYGQVARAWLVYRLTKFS